MLVRPRLLVLCLGLGLALAGVGASAVSAAAPAAVYAVTLTDDGACHFSAAAAWSHTKVNEVVFAWSVGIASWQDDLTSIKGRHATDTFTAGASGTQKNWSVTANFYLDGTFVGTATGSDMVNCALLL